MKKLAVTSKLQINPYVWEYGLLNAAPVGESMVTYHHLHHLQHLHLKFKNPFPKPHLWSSKLDIYKISYENKPYMP